MIYEQYLLTYHRDIIEELLKDNDENRHHSININFVELFENDPNLGKDLLKNPERSLDEWNNAAKTVQNTLTTNNQDFTIKKHVHCRIYSLIRCPELHKSIFPRNDDANKFLQVSGTVVRMTCSKILEFQRKYHCNKCKQITIIKAEIDRKNTIVTPKKCEHCDNTTLKGHEMESDSCKDYQEIKIQETVTKLDFGCMPNSMWVILDDDLVDSCKPGDNITVCGIVKRRWNTFTIGKKLEIELVLYANHIQVNNNTGSVALITPETRTMFENFWETYSNQPLAARDMIIKSICPQIFGLYLVKLAIAVVLAGGSSQIQQDNCNIKVRSEPHLLLVGDPGTGKSQLLRFASRIIPRSVLTTGVGSTAAGLTVTAVMENGEWQLEGGALVLADGGICCIDEFNSMKEHDRTSIHEAMEQQTISVAKASIVCKLSTKCSILAATNPKGNLDLTQPLCMNIALASPLLSRFDLILLLRDKVDQKWDNLIVDYILNDQNSCKLTENISWTIETLQAYFAVIKKNHPTLTPDSHQILSNYYQAQRRKNLRNKSRTTVRLLDSLIRLSQGHARLMFHKQVEIIDAIMAVILIETTMDPESTVFNLQFDIQSDFPPNPMDGYKELVEIILKKLQLENLLEKELENSTKLSDVVKNIHKNNETTTTTNQIESKYFNNQPKIDDNKIISERNSEVEHEELEISNDKKLKRTKSTGKESKRIKLAKTEIVNDLQMLKLLPSINDPFASMESNQEDINLDIDLDNEFSSNNKDIVTSTQTTTTDNSKENTNRTEIIESREEVQSQTTKLPNINDSSASIESDQEEMKIDIDLDNEFNSNKETSTQTTIKDNSKENINRTEIIESREEVQSQITKLPNINDSSASVESDQEEMHLNIDIDNEFNSNEYTSTQNTVKNKENNHKTTEVTGIETRQEQVLSQKTKRRNFFNKFRLQPKQDDCSKIEQNSIFEDQNGEIDDVDLEL